MAVAAPNTLIFELKPVPSPMQHELVRTPIEHRDGWVRPPDGPGLGVEVDEDGRGAIPDQRVRPGWTRDRPDEGTRVGPSLTRHGGGPKIG